MQEPFFSIVVPTRNRGAELFHTLRTCVAQDFDAFGESSFEVVVSDNHSTDDIAAVVASIDSPKVRYLRTPGPLTMNDSWEFAVVQARGRFVGVVGTDDGFLFDALSRCHAMLLDSATEAVTFQGAYYHWPSSNDAALRDKLLVPRFLFQPGVRDTTQLLVDSLRSLHYGLLPCFLNSFVSRALIERVRAQHGRLFDAYCPDVYSGFLVGGSVDRIHVSNDILLVGGVSGSSTGSNAYRNPLAGDWRAELGLRGGDEMARAAIGFPFVSTLIVDSAARALRRLDRAALLDAIDIPVYLRYCYRQAIDIEDRGQRAQAIAAIGDYVRAHRDEGVSMAALYLTRLRWALQAVLPYRLVRTAQRVATMAGSGGGVLANQELDAPALGIHDIYEAARYLTARRSELSPSMAPPRVAPA